MGILNFFNAILTGILSRKREFAMLQAVGMTGRQLKKMLMLEGVLYGGMTILLSLVLILVLEPPHRQDAGIHVLVFCLSL